MNTVNSAIAAAYRAGRHRVDVWYRLEIVCRLFVMKYPQTIEACASD
jgi:hypothetical protein